MPLRPLYGHERLRERLLQALSEGRLPQSVAFVGRPGVGKQRLALWVAQVIQCRAPTPTGPCDSCVGCRRVANLEHPDVHWFVPVHRQEAADPDKAVEKTEQALAEVWAERRGGLYGPPDGMAAHHLAAVRLLLRRLYLKPALGASKVFVIGDAERLVPQESSPDAANALLKALEEPPADTTLLLTVAEAHALLPTVRSRVVAIRVARLPDRVVGEFLEREVRPELSRREIDRRVELAEGSIGSAVQGARVAEAVAAERVARWVREGASGRALAALARPPWSARGEFTAILDALAWYLREQVRTQVNRGAPEARVTVQGLDAVLEVREQAQGNLNPQLLMACLGERLAEVA